MTKVKNLIHRQIVQNLKNQAIRYCYKEYNPTNNFFFRNALQRYVMIKRSIKNPKTRGIKGKTGLK